MGYPKGVDQDKNGNVKPLNLEAVQPKYNPTKALADAKAAAEKFTRRKG